MITIQFRVYSKYSFYQISSGTLSLFAADAFIFTGSFVCVIANSKKVLLKDLHTFKSSHFENEKKKKQEEN